MPDDELLPHIYLPEAGEPLPYTTRNRGGGGHSYPSRNRREHGRSLKDQFQAASEYAESLSDQRRDSGLSEGSQIYLEFRSDSGHDLKLESLENRPRGIELRNVRVLDDVIAATVFVPDGQLEFFLGRVEEYLEEETRTGRPKHEKLIAGIESVRVAVLDSFWTDSDDLFPERGEEIWWEIWLRVEVGQAAEEAVTVFREEGRNIELDVAAPYLRFPDRAVVMAYGDIEAMTRSVTLLASIAEVRRARRYVSEFTELAGTEQAELARQLRGRLSLADNGPAICLLDTGVNRGHVLLQASLTDEDCHTYSPSWGTADDHGHGTQMAGLALLGDLAVVLSDSSTIDVQHLLESVKVHPRGGFAEPDPVLFGQIMEDAAARVESQAPTRSRVFCLAVSGGLPDDLEPASGGSLEHSDEIRKRINEYRGAGRPSSWSAALDSLAAGAQDDVERLIVAAAGNTHPVFRRHYPASNLTESIHDPAQAWNVLTVGAFTMKDRLDGDEYWGWQPMARAGGLSPASTTSLVWDDQWPLKPDVCMEGGNMASDPETSLPDYVDDLQLLTTHHRPGSRAFEVSGDTSAATALCAKLCAQIEAEYPDLWPETVRALVVHSADWTNEMLEHRTCWDFNRRAELRRVLRCYGYGVPDLSRALWSARNALTLVVEDSLQPFDRVDGRYVTREMNTHDLPWPVDALRDLGDTDVELRVTLSYFVEPNPAQRGWWSRRHRYASHGLRFDVRTPLETDEQFCKRVNSAIWTEDDTAEAMTSSDAARWLLGPHLRRHGSVHSDRWRGSAVELAERGYVGVFPVIGWWRERHQLGRWDRRARYALIVSITTPREDVDIYTPVEVATSVEVTA